MTPEAGFFANTFVLRVILLFTIVLLGACGQSEKTVREDVQAEAEVVPLAVRQWYPNPKHMSRPQGGFTPPVNQQFPSIPPQSVNQGYASQAPWPAAAQQPGYVQPSPVIVFQGQQYVPAQSQQGWGYQPPATQSTQPWQLPQQPFAVFAPQYGQRPWGNARGEMSLFRMTQDVQTPRRSHGHPIPIIHLPGYRRLAGTRNRMAGNTGRCRRPIIMEMFGSTRRIHW